MSESFVKRGKKDGKVSIFRGIFTRFLAFSCIACLVFMAIFMYDRVDVMEKGLQNKARFLSGYIAKQAELAVFAEDKASVKKTLAAVSGDGEVEAVTVYSASGDVLASESKDGRVEPSLSAAAIVLLEGPSGTGRSGHEYEAWTPVVFNSDLPASSAFLAGSGQGKSALLGMVHVVMDAGRLRRQMAGFLWKWGITFMVLLAAGTAGVYFLSRSVTDSVTDLMVAVERFGSGDVNARSARSPFREIDDLARKFNLMASSIERQGELNKSLEEQLRCSQKLEAVGTLAGGIAHDLNNILQGVMSYSELMALHVKRERYSELQEVVDKVKGTVARGTKLIAGLLMFSRRQRIRVEKVDLNRVVTRMKEFFEDIIGDDIHFKLEPSDGPLYVLADAGQIEQVIANLVTNARDAMENGGVLAMKTGIKTKDDGEYAFVSVADTGSGIPDDIKDKIFDPFFTTKDVGKGTGLGLSMAYGIIEQHHGSIAVVSGPEGTSVEFSIPLAGVGYKADRKRAGSDLVVDGQPKGRGTVMVVEDEVFVREANALYLREWGFSVVEASSGDEAIEKFGKMKEKVSVVVMDMAMPGRNGRETAEELEKMRPDVKIIYISGYTKDIIPESHALWKNILLKPVKPMVLAQKIDEVMGAGGSA